MKLPQKQLQTIKTTLQQHDVKRADLFGSFARGDADRTSDLDIIFEFRGSGWEKVDLITYDSVYPRIKSSIT